MRRAAGGASPEQLGCRTHREVVEVVGPVLQLLKAPAGRRAIVRGQAGDTTSWLRAGATRTGGTRTAWNPYAPLTKAGKGEMPPWAGRRYERGEGTRAPETTLGPGSWRGLLPAPSHHGLYSPRAGITEPPARLRLSLQVQKGATGRGRCPEHSQYTPWVRAWWGAGGRGEGGGRGGGARRPPPRTPAPAPPCPPSPRPHPTCCFQEPRAHLGTG